MHPPLSGEGSPPLLLTDTIATSFAFMSALILMKQTKKEKPLPFTLLLILKITVSVLMAILMLFHRLSSTETTDILGDTLFFSSLALNTFIHLQRQRLGSVTSGSQHISALFFLICALFRLNKHQNSISALHIWLLVLNIILLCFADSRHEGVKIKPEKDSSFLSQLTENWFNRIPLTGHKRTLEVEDLFDVEEELTSTHFQEKWEEEWGNKRKAYMEELKVSKRLGGPDYTAGPSLAIAILSIFKWQFLEMFAMKLFSDVLQFANPFMMSVIISVFSSVTPSLSTGIYFAILMFSVSQMRSFVTNRYFHLLSRMGVSVQSLLSNAIYQKTLSLSSKVRRDKSTGEIVNLLSSDVETAHIIVPQMQQFWSCPFQIILCLIYLFHTLGYSALPGVIIMLISLPITLLKTKITKSWQEEKMKLNDQRSKIIHEVLSGIKVVKLYSWEKPMEECIEDLWRKEVALMRKCSLVDGLADAFSYSSPFLVALFSFGSFVLSSSDNVLSPKTAFVSLTLFNYLWTPLFLLSFYFGQAAQLLVTIRRLKSFFFLGEVDPSVVATIPKEKNAAVEWRDYTASWDKTTKETLTSIDLTVGKGQFICVVGKVGSGKSSLFGSLLGELTTFQGHIGMQGTVAYVPQQPWIQNMSVRDNILMNKPFDKTFYNQVLFACCLKQDLCFLPKGDLTEIGEKGANLSGGQKARLALARAIYQDGDVYLLDDPLSVVDVHVGRHIMQHVIGHKGILRDKTRILVTHVLSYVQNADSIVVMEDGKIVEMGRHSELEERKGPFCAFLEQLKTNDGRETSVEATLLDAEEDISLEKDKEDTAKAVGPELLKKEKEKVGWVGWKVYQSFFQSASYSRCLGFLLTSTAFFGLQTCRGFHLTSWTAQSTFSSNQTDSRMLAIYAATGASEALAFVLSMLCLTSATVAVSLNLHRPLLRTVLRSPMLFFDSTPIGDVLNRFVTDMYMIDFALPFTFRLLITSILQATMAVSAIIISTPMFLFVVVPLAVVYWNLLSISVPTTRQLRRLEGFFRSPIVSKLSEMASGVSSIRAFQKMEYFRSSFGLAVDQLIRCRYMSALGERWLATRLAILGNLVVFFAVLFASFSQSFGWTESPGTVAFIIFSSINITDSLLVAVRQICFTEANISAVERIREFSSLPTEEQEVKDALETSIPTSWPESGNISFIHYSAKYRPSLDLVLNDIHVDIRSGEKVGIVGRTGAGKSSFVLALFRMIEAEEGEIKIDGVDIKSLDLHRLRENLTIIPQDPVLFPGSLRFNLDPSGVFSEKELQEAIELAHLTDLVSSSQKGLQMNISSRGDGLSGGQRQLICLARAILHKSKILVLDEATAAVDVATESWIQKTIKDQFSSSTVITVAHRINTIMDYDRILLLDNGNIAESGAPRDLLRQRNSLFSKLAANEQHL